MLFLWAIAAHAEHRPNIVLILTDNQSEKLLGAYGNEDIKTPNIDQLASEGVTFTHAFAASGVCSPTRATLMTGLMPSQHGVHNAMPSEFGVDDWNAIEEFRNLPQTLGDAGYSMAMIGKYHLGVPFKAQLGFDEWVTFATGHTTSFHNVEVIDNGETYTLDNEHLTDYWTRKAVAFLGAQADSEPFFLFLSYNGPYNLPPLVLEPPRNRYAAYYRENVPAFPQEPVNPSLRRLAIEYSNIEALLAERDQWWYDENDNPDEATAKIEDAWPWQTIDALNNPTAMIHLASQMSMIDDGVGDVLQALEDNGFADNTIVIFTSDQSSAFGQHGLWGNSSYAEPHPAYMENMRVPLIVRTPDAPASGSQSEQVINQVDLFPTLLDLVGLGDKMIADSPGRSFAPSLRGEDQVGFDAAYFEYITVRAIATREWKFVKRLFGDPPELYDLVRDPEERDNLASDSAYQSVVESLDQQLTEFFAQYSTQRYDVWKGGSAKALLMYNDKNDDFEETFPGFVPPTIEKARPFAD
ncbi:MAG: sulfatase-like hydrolase/transferase [Pseudomonadota bacterium]